MLFTTSLVKLLTLFVIVAASGEHSIEVQNSLAMCSPPCNCTISNTVTQDTPGINMKCCMLGLKELPLLPPLAEEVSLSHNQISNIKEDSFSHLPRLQTVDLSYNTLNLIPETAFFMTSQLKSINLSHNQFEEVPIGLPFGLMQLDMSYNVVKMIDTVALEGLYLLKELNLDENDIALIHKSSFRTTDKGPQIHPGEAKSNPNIMEVMKKYFLPNLRKISLRNNQILKIESGALDPLVSLTHLDLSGNYISSIPVDLFKSLPQLHSVNLARNQLNTIKNGTFKGIISLRYLDLSRNYLTTLPIDIPPLRWLDMSHNKITSIPKKYSDVILPVELFTFASNPLYCDCEILWLKELYDTRDFMLQYIDGSDGHFVPQCSGPSRMAGELWDSLADSLFTCEPTDYKPQPTKDRHLESASIVTQYITFNVTISEALSTNLTIQWTMLNRHDIPFDGIIIEYHIFGDIHKNSVHVKKSKSQYSLRSLKPGTNYVICLSAYEATHGVPRFFTDNCLEIATVSEIEVSKLQAVGHWIGVVFDIDVKVISWGMSLACITVFTCTIALTIRNVMNRDFGVKL